MHAHILLAATWYRYAVYYTGTAHAKVRQLLGHHSQVAVIYMAMQGAFSLIASGGGGNRDHDWPRATSAPTQKAVLRSARVLCGMYSRGGGYSRCGIYSRKYGSDQV